MIWRARPRTSTTSGGAGVRASGAYTATPKGAFRRGSAPTSSMRMYCRPTMVPTTSSSSFARSGGSAIPWVYEPTGQL